MSYIINFIISVFPSVCKQKKCPLTYFMGLFKAENTPCFFQ